MTQNVTLLQNVYFAFIAQEILPGNQNYKWVFEFWGILIHSYVFKQITIWYFLCCHGNQLYLATKVRNDLLGQ